MVLARPQTGGRRFDSPSAYSTEVVRRTVEGPTRSARARRRTRSLALAALCVALVVGETLLLMSLRAGSAVALAPQVAAPAPWGVFHDVRWLVVYAGSWPVLIAGGLAIVLGRGAITAVMVKAAWPAQADAASDKASGVPSPMEPLSWRTALVRGCTSTAIAALVLSPCASLLVAFELAPISDLWLAATATALGVALFLHHAPVDCWWLRHPRLRSIGWMLVSYVELTIAGAVMTAAPRAWAPLVAVLAGLADAWAWRGVVRALARPARARYVPVSPVGLVAVIAVTVASVTAAAAPSSAASAPPKLGRGAALPAGVKPTPALIVSGYGVSWRGGPVDLGPAFKERQFSYRGVSKTGKPLPYSASATQESLPVLLQRFRQQVDALVRQSGRHIDIVGESEGSLLAEIYLLTTPNPPVDNLVLLSPLVEPSRASYPERGGAGPGLAAAWELRGIAGATSAMTPLSVSADSPFIRSLSDHPDALRDTFGCQVPGVPEFAILPLADAVGVPPKALSVLPHETVAALHGTLLADPGVRADVARYLTGSPPPSGENALEQLVSIASAAWHAPPRRLRAPPPPGPGCQAATAALRAWLGAPAS